MAKNVKLLKRELTLEDCLYWSDNKTKNPITKYKLKEDSKLLKEIEKECTELLNKNIKKEEIKIIESHYPNLEDTDFASKLSELYEFYLYKVKENEKIKSVDEYYSKSNELCSVFEKTMYQYFVSNYISSRTPYKGILLYHGVGVGKTCSAITLAESFLSSHTIDEEPKIWVIMPQSLKPGFKEQIFSLTNYEDNFKDLANQCTGDLYIKLGNVMRNSEKDRVKHNVNKLINSRYRIFTYDKFVSFIENEYTSKQRIVKDRVIIIDEAHNIRSENMEKDIYSTLLNVAKSGINNRMVLLSATPMYNTVDDILYLLYLLVLNDKRDILKLPFPSLENVSKSDEIKIKQLASNYISYLRGKNPFTFALELSPKFASKNIKYLDKEFTKDSNDNQIDLKYKNWLQNIDDSITISDIGEYQKKYISNQNENNILNLQNTNIVYDNYLGEKGFNTFFTRNGENNLSVKYNQKYKNALYPDEDHLGKYSGKMLNISKIIQNTEGVVVIYSGYIWNGIIPMAICLEHMGFQREESNNILDKPTLISNPIKYAKGKPRYCILSSDNSDVMKGSSFDSLVAKINSSNNIDGSKIKVVLITPVASEGLSFFNVREMHIMEPWFHFNKLKQVIGRGIRNCRHRELPLEKRNVNVFIHVSYNDDKKETSDIHALRISSYKFLSMNKIETIIKNNAIDCFLMKNMNYFPKNIFELGNMKIIDSQNNVIKYELGDDEKLKPTCRDITPKKFTGFRKDTYKHLIPMIQNKIRKLVINNIQNEIWYITIDEFIKKIDFDEKLLFESIKHSIYPNTLIDGYILFLYNNGVHIMKIQQQKLKKIKLVKESSKVVKKSVCSNKDLRKISKEGFDHTVASIYLSFNEDCFTNLMKSIIISDDRDEQLNYIANALYVNGVLIKNDELISLNMTKTYIGYINIFNSTYEPIIYHNNVYRDPTERELREILSHRKKKNEIPDMTKEVLPWGIIVPSKKGNKFKILTPGKGKGVKTGRECLTLEKDIQDSLLKALGANINGTKAENCNSIMKLLINSNRMTLNPEYVPK